MITTGYMVNVKFETIEESKNAVFEYIDRCSIISNTAFITRVYLCSMLKNNILLCQYFNFTS
jgi:hypothetical protein